MVNVRVASLFFASSLMCISSSSSSSSSPPSRIAASSWWCPSCRCTEGDDGWFRMRNRVTRQRSRTSSAGTNSVGKRTCKESSCFFTAGGTLSRGLGWCLSSSVSEAAASGDDGAGGGASELNSRVRNRRLVGSLGRDIAGDYRCGHMLCRAPCPSGMTYVGGGERHSDGGRSS